MKDWMQRADERREKEMSQKPGRYSGNGICELCGELMPRGEETLRYHGHSGPCPTSPAITKPEVSEKAKAWANSEDAQAGTSLELAAKSYDAGRAATIEEVLAVVEKVMGTHGAASAPQALRELRRRLEDMR